MVHRSRFTFTNVVITNIIWYYVCKYRYEGVMRYWKADYPDTEHPRILQQMGEQIKLARLRRNIPVQLIAERSGLGRTTIWQIEKGSPSVSMGAYAKVLHAIEGMDKELLRVCREDAPGRVIQDAILVRRRASGRRRRLIRHDQE